MYFLLLYLEAVRLLCNSAFCGLSPFFFFKEAAELSLILP